MTSMKCIFNWYLSSTFPCCYEYSTDFLVYDTMILSKHFIFALQRNLQFTYWYTIWSVLSQEQQTVDPFVIYNPLYSVLRECVSGAVYGKQFQQLMESTRVGIASNTIYNTFNKEYCTRLCKGMFYSSNIDNTILFNVIPSLSRI